MRLYNVTSCLSSETGDRRYQKGDARQETYEMKRYIYTKRQTEDVKKGQVSKENQTRDRKQ